MKMFLISICFLGIYVSIASAQITSISLEPLATVSTHKYTRVQTDSLAQQGIFISAEGLPIPPRLLYHSIINEITWSFDAIKNKAVGDIELHFWVKKMQPQNFEIVKDIGYGSAQAIIDIIKRKYWSPGIWSGPLMDTKFKLEIRVDFSDLLFVEFRRVSTNLLNEKESQTPFYC
ncbi:hypothetical protein G5B00_01595 [Parapedobacter sp. SGR-10]|uniref:hypothetical protein n=1 Tax=Parapedobacter sp. SGR-10 TaxID=2710879 RepID=UPI0013D08FEA|nr:hypothetical protein [Parapedobacter sp. SGR-10]NGF55193.1 hypothetical protein [Parapedobacter sp. SGR-10]